MASQAARREITHNQVSAPISFPIEEKKLAPIVCIVFSSASAEELSSILIYSRSRFADLRSCGLHIIAPCAPRENDPFGFEVLLTHFDLFHACALACKANNEYNIICPRHTCLYYILYYIPYITLLSPPSHILFPSRMLTFPTFLSSPFSRIRLCSLTVRDAIPSQPRLAFLPIPNSLYSDKASIPITSLKEWPGQVLYLCMTLL